MLILWRLGLSLFFGLVAKQFIPFFSFGSIIVGAIRTKFAAKGSKNGETKSSTGTKKGSRGSFSFKGGMQVMISQRKLDFRLDHINKYFPL